MCDIYFPYITLHFCSIDSTMANKQTVTLDNEKCKKTKIVRDLSVPVVPGLFTVSVSIKSPNIEPLK